MLQLLGRSAAANSLETIQQLETELDALLDQCDAFTGILETMLRHEVPVQEVEPVYQNLMGQTELFRETLDERLAVIPEA